MTYFGFLFRFVLIPIIILLVGVIWGNRKSKKNTGPSNGRTVGLAIGTHILLAVLYTTPWDNYLVATGVWYYNPKLVTGIIFGYVPIEEYTFFILETILAGLWWWFLARGMDYSSGKSAMGKGEFTPNKHIIYFSASGLVFIWSIFTYLFFFSTPNWTYLSITLFWALPAILPQLIYGADILWHYRKLVFWSIFVPGAYLSLMDMFALNATTWSISKTQTTGINLFGLLPLEEIVFFFITNTLITFGMTLLLTEPGQKRINGWRVKFREHQSSHS